MYSKIWMCFYIASTMQPGMLRAETVTVEDAIVQLSKPANFREKREAIKRLGNILRTGLPDDVCATQNRLCQEMAALSDCTAIQQICLVFASAPTEEAVSIVLDKLRNEVSQKGRVALCSGLGMLLDKEPLLQAATQSLVISRLEAILKDRFQPLVVIESAQMALAQLGSVGFDRMMQLKEDAENPKIMNIFYSSLGLTEDPRALPVLRSAIADQSTNDGTRIEAIYALGQMFASFTSSEQSVESNESALCIQLLYPFLADSVPDQVFAVTLRSLGKMVFADKDPQVHAALLQALRSENVHRRESSLDVIYMTDADWDADTMARVKWISESDSEAVCRSTAQAIVDKYAADVEPMIVIME